MRYISNNNTQPTWQWHSKSDFTPKKSALEVGLTGMAISEEKPIRRRQGLTHSTAKVINQLNIITVLHGI